MVARRDRHQLVPAEHLDLAALVAERPADDRQLDVVAQQPADRRAGVRDGEPHDAPGVTGVEDRQQHRHHRLAGTGLATSVRTPPVPSRSASRSRSSVSSARTTRAPCSRTRWPATVSRALRAGRANSGCPKCSSSARTCSLTDGWVIPSRRAAAEKLPSSTIVRNVWRLRSSGDGKSDRHSSTAASRRRRRAASVADPRGESEMAGWRQGRGYGAVARPRSSRAPPAGPAAVPRAGTPPPAGRRPRPPSHRPPVRAAAAARPSGAPAGCRRPAALPATTANVRAASLPRAVHAASLSIASS